MMALTATATPRVQKDILNQLNMTRPQVYVDKFRLLSQTFSCSSLLAVEMTLLFLFNIFQVYYEFQPNKSQVFCAAQETKKGWWGLHQLDQKELPT